MEKEEIIKELARVNLSLSHGDQGDPAIVEENDLILWGHKITDHYLSNVEKQGLADVINTWFYGVEKQKKANINQDRVQLESELKKLL